MKRDGKKLGLRKETLRLLSDFGLGAARGGDIGPEPNSFRKTCAGCETEDGACTVPYTGCLASCSCGG